MTHEEYQSNLRLHHDPIPMTDLPASCQMGVACHRPRLGLERVDLEGSGCEALAAGSEKIRLERDILPGLRPPLAGAGMCPRAVATGVWDGRPRGLVDPETHEDR